MNHYSFSFFQNSKSKIKNLNSDFIGAMSAFLCIIHCAIVPILMGIHSFYYAGDALVSHTEHSHSHSSLHSLNFLEGSHWHTLDYFFIAITLIAVYFATRRSIVSWVKTGLWSAASLFVISILLEEFIVGIEYLAYFASALLIVFHFLNQRLDKKVVPKTNNIKEEELNFERNSFDSVTLETKTQSKKSNRVSCAC
ncbi:MerC domain-containing protein [Bernardetia sp. ABR2-2B]|uniref:MerC domain-containing protein n=1 Tax=Bernardetia sp. ABR2-2B TaxID=3127472 RepID=UPI0030CBB83E